MYSIVRLPLLTAFGLLLTPVAALADTPCRTANPPARPQIEAPRPTAVINTANAPQPRDPWAVLACSEARNGRMVC